MATVGLLYHRFGVAEACANPHVSNKLMANRIAASEVLRLFPKFTRLLHSTEVQSFTVTSFNMPPVILKDAKMPKLHPNYTSKFPNVGSCGQMPKTVFCAMGLQLPSLQP